MVNQDQGGEKKKLALRACDAAEMLSISPRTLWKWTQEGRIPHRKLDRVTLYPVPALEAWLAGGDPVPSLQDWIDSKLDASSEDAPPQE